MKSKLILTAIIFLGLFFRLYHLSSLPVSLYGDELEVGYQAWSLASNAKDYYGNFLPTELHGFFEYRAPLVMYLTAPFIALFGPATFSVRFPTALMGILSIFLIYQIAKRIKDRQTALLAALLFAISPWHIHLSRGSFETISLTALLMVSVLFFLKGLSNYRYLWLSAICFCLSLYTYPIAAALVPLTVLSLWFVYRKEINLLKGKKYLVLTFIVLSAPFVYQVFFSQAANRISQINIFSDPKTVEDIIIQRTDPWITDNWGERIFHNKGTAFASVFAKQYLEAFSPQFLFLNGDPLFRHSVGRFGELLWITAPFLLVGFIKLCQNLKEKSSRLIILWLLVSPIPSAVTQGGGMHASRLLPVLLPLILITAIGFNQTLLSIKSKTIKRIVLVLIVLFLTFNFANYWHRYQNHYRYESARIWQFGYQDIFSKLRKYQDSANKIYINNTYEPSLLHFAFHTQYSPVEFQQNVNKIDKIDINNLFKGFIFGNKYYFGQIEPNTNFLDLLGKGDIYLAVQGIEVAGDWNWAKNPPAGLKILDYTNDVFGKPLFYLVTRD